MSQSLSYRRELDGLRGIAVGSVVLFHAGFGFPGGFIGVDVFFVISGFLITSIILKQVAAGTFTLANFWERRIRRIVPAMVVMVLATLAIGSTFMMPEDFEKVGKSSIFQMLGASNFYFWQDMGYFSEAAELKPLLHTWSLAVEEQFYVLLPLMLIAIAKVNLKRVQPVLIGLLFASFAGCLATMHFSTAETAFFLLPSRAWELLVGSLLATQAGALPTLSRRVGEPLSWLGVAGIMWPCLTYSSETTFPGLTAVPPVLGTALIIFVTKRSDCLVKRLLSWRPLVGLGLVSYSLYLWHWPLLAFARYWFYPLPTGVALAVVAMSLIAAYLSWRYVETPFRTQQINWSRATLFRRAIQIQASVVMIGLVLDGLEGIPARVPAAIREMSFKNVWATATNQAIAEGKLPRLGVKDENVPPSFLLWGDSHGRASAQFIDNLAKQHGIAGLAAIKTFPDAKIIPRPDDEVIKERNRRIEELIYERGLKTVIIVQRWEYAYAYRAENWQEFEDEHDFSAAEMAQMDQTLPELAMRLADRGVQLYVVGQPPCQKGNRLFKSVLYRATVFGNADGVPTTTLDEYESERFWLDRLAELDRLPNVHVLDPCPYCFNDRGQSIIYANGKTCYRDDNHLSDHGAEMFLTPLFDPVFRDLSRQLQPTHSISESPAQMAEQPGTSTVR